MSLKSDLVSAIMLLTRLPVRGTPTARAADAAWAWPLVGGGLGVIAGLLGWGVGLLGVTPAVAAAVTLVALIGMTGALHEDGLADVCDGFWGGYTPERRLEIMRDSRVGSYGVIALVLSLLLRWSLIATALVQGHMLSTVVIAAVVSRAPMAILMRWLPAARADGLSRGSGVPSAAAAQIGILLAALVLIGPGGHGLLAGVMVTAVLLTLGWLARTKIGGQTGDVLGACQQLCEIAVLVALTSG
ncbi:adenosylcobinamide-GDP ribazoletransferase [Jannaschia pohangensis]|uniref:Adenosylcobinamide-GDP ribazoletransferase n=1 Tax=Jannaschia pohangensis TaxID=390807 RepID=A0A1I3M071_9RHOB|nr:adenosylcobinamide-GDP ribazoletransferase [Jannaschia pohangensis]SFI90327.1 cobalamin-5'-phosphate synthase [Jannaschia pohangensis]